MTRRRYRLAGSGDPFIDMVWHHPKDERIAFVTAAQEMRDSEWWREIPTYEQPGPEPVAGEFEAK